MNKLHLRLIIGIIISSISISSYAGDEFKNISNLNQSQFGDLTADVGAGYSYKSMNSASTLGITGFNVGLSTHFTPVKHKSTYKTANANDSKNINITQITFEKGLPANFDLGVAFSKIDNGSLIGLQVKNQLLEDTPSTPAVSLAGNYTQSLSADHISFQDIGIEAVASKNIILFTPYAGIGYHQSTLKAKNSGLSSETKSQFKMLLGGKVTIGILDISLELAKFGNTTSTGLKFAVGI